MAFTTSLFSILGPLSFSFSFFLLHLQYLLGHFLSPINLVYMFFPYPKGSLMVSDYVTMVVLDFKCSCGFGSSSSKLLSPLIPEIISSFLLKVYYFLTYLFHINFFGSVGLSSQLIIEPSIFIVCGFCFSSLIHFVDHCLSAISVLPITKLDSILLQ